MNRIGSRHLWLFGQSQGVKKLRYPFTALPYLILSLCLWLKRKWCRAGHTVRGITAVIALMRLPMQKRGRLQWQR